MCDTASAPSGDRPPKGVDVEEFMRRYGEHFEPTVVEGDRVILFRMRPRPGDEAILRALRA